MGDIICLKDTRNKAASVLLITVFSVQYSVKYESKEAKQVMVNIRLIYTIMPV